MMMPTWGWAVTVAGGVVLGAVGGFAFAAWLIGMNLNDRRRAQGNTPMAPPPDN
jgi:hypothetical protein